MSLEDVFVGNIKQCINLEKYRQYGDYNTEVLLYIDGRSINRDNNYSKVISRNVLFVRVNEDEYAWLDELSITPMELNKIDLTKNVLKTYPTHDGSLFVDEESLISYLEFCNSTGGR